MGLTLSHLSALDVIRVLRSKAVNLHEMDTVPLFPPTPWVGKRWTRQSFDPSIWPWPRPHKTQPLDVLTPRRERRIQAKGVTTHTVWQKLPPNSLLWLDQNASIAGPELLFLQMAEVFSLPALVLLGYELCGCFSRTAEEPLEAKVAMDVPAATNVENIIAFLDGFNHVHGLARAREAIQYVSNNALSAPESVLATIYSLPVKYAGYGMGPVTLNEHIVITNADEKHMEKARYPDLLFSFGNIGINYDGENHLNLSELAQTAHMLVCSEGTNLQQARVAVQDKQREIREKVIDDTTRNRQLATKGYLVFPATKENLYGWGNLDAFTRDLLACARIFFGVDIRKFEEALNDTDKTRDRNELLASMLPSGRPWGSSHGKL